METEAQAIEATEVEESGQAVEAEPACEPAVEAVGAAAESAPPPPPMPRAAVELAQAQVEGAKAMVTRVVDGMIEFSLTIRGAERHILVDTEVLNDDVIDLISAIEALQDEMNESEGGEGAKSDHSTDSVNGALAKQLRSLMDQLICATVVEWDIPNRHKLPLPVEPEAIRRDLGAPTRARIVSGIMATLQPGEDSGSE